MHTGILIIYSMVCYIKGDLFALTSRHPAVLIHACNPFGLWGGGIAAVFKKKYPSAYKVYASHCEKNGPALMGLALVIPTTADDPGNIGRAPVYVACLFTSDFESAVPVIIENTRTSMRQLQHQLRKLHDLEKINDSIVVNMPKINSGIFNVPWSHTEAVLKEFTDLHINVYTI